MARKCVECGEEFELEETMDAIRDEYNGDVDPEELFDMGGAYIKKLCPDCAICECDSLMQAGRDYMNGD